MVVKHDHVLGCLAQAVGWVVLDKAEVVSKLEAAGPGANENDTGVVCFGQKGKKVLHGCSRPRGVCCHSQRHELAVGLTLIVLSTGNSRLENVSNQSSLLLTSYY